ncbi:hypothetical protein FGO68_gene12075 [Halteria grandinella]|uniref:Uncharacterized protein n=1 Tax=Halteria grandinella TaxID=5974 RepID=A0A8J8P1F0_HALGN|nr:hypothetical protein FGO68_gene12075 [Halteria grandinella]
MSNSYNNNNPQDYPADSQGQRRNHQNMQRRPYLEQPRIVEIDLGFQDLYFVDESAWKIFIVCIICAVFAIIVCLLISRIAQYVAFLLCNNMMQGQDLSKCEIVFSTSW